MAWTTFARTDFAANDAGRTGRGDYLVERDTLAAGRPFAAEQFAEFSTASTSMTDAANFTIRVPDFAVSGWFIHAAFEVHIDGSETNGQIRLVNVTDSKNGKREIDLSNTSYALTTGPAGEDSLSVEVNAGPHSDVNIKVQVRAADGADLMYVRNTQSDYYYAMMWWEPTGVNE